MSQTEASGDLVMTRRQRRQKRTYLRLAAYLASKADETDCLELGLEEIEEILGEPLPSHASFPFWWNNEGFSAHSRAWLSSGWEVALMDQRARRVSFVRREP